MSAFLDIDQLWGMAIPKHDVADGAGLPKRVEQLGQSDDLACSVPMATSAVLVCIKHSRVGSGHQIDSVREFIFAEWLFSAPLVNRQASKSMPGRWQTVDSKD